MFSIYGTEKLTLIHGSARTLFTGSWQGGISVKTAAGGAVRSDDVTVYIFDTSLEIEIGDRIERAGGEQTTVYAIERNITASPHISHIRVKGA